MSNEQKELLIRDNDLIRSIYTGSRIESKILHYAMYQLQKTREPVMSCTTKQLVEGLGLSVNSHDTGAMLHRLVPALLGHKIIIRREEGGRVITEGFTVVSYCRYDDGVFTIELNQRLLPYLVDISSPYTAIEINKLLSFDSSTKTKNFSMRLYEILRTKKYLLKNTDVITEYFTIADLKIRTGLVNVDEERAADIIRSYGLSEETVVQLGGDRYPAWRDLKRRVLDPAVAEISETTDISVTYRAVKVGRSNKVIGVIFSIRERAEEETVMPERVESPEEDFLFCEKAELVEEVRSLTGMKLGDSEIESILTAADWNLERVRDAYVLAGKQKNKIRDMSRWLICAVRERWAEKTGA